LFGELRLKDKNPDSDQEVYAKVLAATDGPVNLFKAKYPHIFNRR
jgi:hypothetical protein